jgi:hypothetical protein
MNSPQFMDECVRISKPCKFEGMAKTWKGFTDFKFGEEGYTKMTNIISNAQVNVYIDTDSSTDMSDKSGNSFKDGTTAKMKYSDFLHKMSQNAVGVVMKDDSYNV